MKNKTGGVCRRSVHKVHAVKHFHHFISFHSGAP